MRTRTFSYETQFPKIITKHYGMFPELFFEPPERRQTNSTLRFPYFAVLKCSN